MSVAYLLLLLLFIEDLHLNPALDSTCIDKTGLLTDSMVSVNECCLLSAAAAVVLILCKAAPSIAG